MMAPIGPNSKDSFWRSIFPLAGATLYYLSAVTVNVSTVVAVVAVPATAALPTGKRALYICASFSVRKGNFKRHFTVCINLIPRGRVQTRTLENRRIRKLDENRTHSGQIWSVCPIHSHYMLLMEFDGVCVSRTNDLIIIQSTGAPTQFTDISNVSNQIKSL